MKITAPRLTGYNSPSDQINIIKAVKYFLIAVSSKTSAVPEELPATESGIQTDYLKIHPS